MEYFEVVESSDEYLCNHPDLVSWITHVERDLPLPIDLQARLEADGYIL